MPPARLKYRHLFFDLDHTLWDFALNSQQVLHELFADYDLHQKLAIEVREFITTYQHINDRLWGLYRQGKITKERLRIERFLSTLATFGLPDKELAKTLEGEYLRRAPYQKGLMVGCLPMLDALKTHFQLHIITNGFNETQHIKLKESGLRPYFDLILTSDQVQVHKPQAKIFIEALKRTGAQRSDSIMIGDNLLADIQGARNVGIDQVFYNPLKTKHQEKPTFEITQLADLPPLLL